MSDRTVHGRSRNDWEVVRYNRAGKWYLEREGEKRESLKLEDAARIAAWADFYPGKPGGQAFDARVRKIRSAARGLQIHGSAQEQNAPRAFGDTNK